MTDVTERGLDKLLLGLGAQLEAAERRADEEAANDFAFSLAQDSLMADALTRAGAVTVMTPGGGRLSVSAVGEDFLWIEGSAPQLIPLAQSAFKLEDRGRAPARWQMSQLEACRELARTGAIVEVTCSFGSALGKLERAARDFLSVATDHGRVLAPYAAFQAIRVIRGGLTGDP
ncbi:MAG: hypothetical protein GEU68_15485 [Actinobacteria bacterium]|nr:hypothetical protein [Actinomycetota bacterium]